MSGYITTMMAMEALIGLLLALLVSFLAGFLSGWFWARNR